MLYSGVQIGDVVDLKLNPLDPSQVRVLIRVDQDIPIRENTQASLVLANITGSMSLRIRRTPSWAQPHRGRGSSFRFARNGS